MMYLNDFPVDVIHKFLVAGAVVQLIVLLEFIVAFLNQAKRILSIQIFTIPHKKP